LDIVPKLHNHALLLYCIVSYWKTVEIPTENKPRVWWKTILSLSYEIKKGDGTKIIVYIIR